MACELFLLSSLWFLFVIFWMETISIWLFLCNFYQDRAFYHWGERVFVADPGHMLHVFVSDDGPGWPQASPNAWLAQGRWACRHHRAMRSQMGIPQREVPAAAQPEICSPKKGGQWGEPLWSAESLAAHTLPSRGTGPGISPPAHGLWVGHLDAAPLRARGSQN